MEKKVFFQEEITKLDNGEFVEYSSTTKSIKPREPDYVKLYLRTVLAANDVPIVFDSMLNMILLRMTYADDDEGQIVYITKDDREKIAKKLNLTPDYVKKSIYALRNKCILKQISVSKYQVNPHLFGKGDWKSIEKLRSKFIFSEQGIEIETDVEYAEESNERE
jgi:biotin operon repressor